MESGCKHKIKARCQEYALYDGWSEYIQCKGCGKVLDVKAGIHPLWRRVFDNIARMRTGWQR